MSQNYATPPAPSAQPAPARAGNGLATAGFVLGLLGFLGSFIPVLNIVGIAMGVVGAILAGFGLNRARTSASGKGLAISGLVLGVLALIIGVVVNVAFANAVDNAIEDTTDTSVEAPAESADDAAAEEPADAAEEDAEPAASAVGTTRDNPAPLGSAINGGDWTVTINTVTPAEADSLGQTAQAGSTLLVVNLTATYNGTDEQGATPWASVEFVTPEGTTVTSYSGSTLFIPDSQFDSLATLYEGASTTGNQIFEVPANWQEGVLVVSPDLMADSVFVAVQ